MAGRLRLDQSWARRSKGKDARAAFSHWVFYKDSFWDSTWWSLWQGWKCVEEKDKFPRWNWSPWGKHRNESCPWKEASLSASQKRYNPRTKCQQTSRTVCPKWFLEPSNLWSLCKNSNMNCEVSWLNRNRTAWQCLGCWPKCWLLWCPCGSLHDYEGTLNPRGFTWCNGWQYPKEKDRMF